MKLALGTVQFGLNYGLANSTGQVPIKEAKLIIEKAQKYGMDSLDTAISYGESEMVLGKCRIENWKTTTKLPAVPEYCSNVQQWAQEQIHQSMARLKVTQLHGVLLHRPSQLLEPIGTALFAALQEIKYQGLTRNIGISIYAPDELDVLFDNFSFDLVQAPLNILDRNLIESGWAKRLQDAGVEIHTRSSFLQGLLLIPPSQRPSKFNRWSDVWHVWDLWLNRVRLTPLQACLRYVCNLSSINRIVVGVDSVTQLAQIVEAAEGTLTSLPEFNNFQDKRLINPTSWNQL